MKNAVCTWTYDPVLTDKKTSLRKHKIGARDRMLGYQLVYVVFVAGILQLSLEIETLNILRNSKLGIWPPDLPDLVYLPTNIDKQTHVTWVMFEYDTVRGSISIK